VSDNRGLRYAIAASLALHALVLFAFRDLVATARRAASIPPQIIARLMEPEPAPPVPVPAPPVQPQPPVPPEKKKAPAAKKPAPVLSTPQPAPAPAVPAPPPAVAAEAPTPPQPAPPPLVAQQSQPPPQPPAQPAQPPESLSRDQYRLQLIDEARRHKRYPPLARENNWQGDVRVGVTIAANGRPSVTLRGSSGYEVLDRQALEMFSQAARSVPVPPALRGQEFSLELRAVYGLED
jgi:periplasmic protein TonB